MKKWIYWKLTHLRDRFGFLATPIDYLRYEWFYPDDDYDL